MRKIEKAFDRVNHQKLIDCLTRTNMRDRDITFIKNLYWTQKAYIKLENTVSNDIKIKRGVRQGCVLSPSLFNLYTEHIFRSLEDLEGVNIGGMNVALAHELIKICTSHSCKVEV